MLDNFHLEREEQNRRHALEKEKMREMYEYSMKEREMELMRQVAVLEEQLHLSRRFEGLVERNQNAYSPRKFWSIISLVLLFVIT